MSSVEKGLGSRLALGVSGQAVSRVVSTINTIVLVPILIHGWGLRGYGEWIALTALSSYVSVANFGLVTTLAYDMVMAVGAKNFAQAKRTFQNSINVTLYLILPTIAALTVLLTQLPISRLLKLQHVTGGEAAWIVALTGGLIGIQTLRGMAAAALYASGSYGLSYYIAAGAKLVELIGIAVAVGLFHGIAGTAASIMAACAMVDLVLVSLCVARWSTWATIDLRVFDRAWLLGHAKPTFGLLLSTLANQSVLVQGPRVILGIMLGGQAVALYAVYATAVRLVDQLLLAIALPMGMEISRAIGAGDKAVSYRLITLGNRISWLLFVGVSLFLLAAGPLIFKLWTAGRVGFDYQLMSLYLLMSAFVQLGRVSWISLVSSNRLYGPSFVTFFTAVFSVGFGASLVPPMGLAGMIIGGVIGEAINALAMTFIVSRWMERSWTSFFWDMFNAPAAWRDARGQFSQLLNRLRRPAGRSV